MLEEGSVYLSQDELFECKSRPDIRAKISNYK
jgi:hypothetical protein